MQHANHEMAHQTAQNHEHAPQQNNIHTHGGGAQEFLKRFYIVTFLLLPLLATSMLGIQILGYTDFSLRPYLEFAFASGIFYFALIFFEHASHEIKSRKLGMMTLVSVAVGAGFVFSAAGTFLPSIDTEFYLEISSLIWILLFGHYLEAKSSTAAGDALQEVAKLLPKEAHLVHQDHVMDVPITDLKEGDIVLVKPGEKVPADGVIKKGESNFDEALISGESKPISKTVGARVVAGSISLDSSVEVTLDRVGSNSTIGQIQQLISQAQQTKPSAQKLADKAASWLTITALIVALLTILFWTFIGGATFTFALTLAITVLVIACPHALGLAIPTVSTIATQLAVKNGIFIKDMGKLEVVKNGTYIVFDKTGTLTQGKFGVSEIVSLDEKTHSNDEILKLAAAIEQSSSHVIGLSILEYAKIKKIQIPSLDTFKNIAGKGISGKVDSKLYWVGNAALMEDQKILDANSQKAYTELSDQGKTVIFVANESKVLGLIALSDTVKPSAINAVAGLHKLGIKVAMLTGDNKKVAQSVAKELNIDTYFAQVLPENKYEHIKELQKKGENVLMVGDGVNDAPALTQANVGIAVGAGTEVAVEAGDIILTQSNPEDIVALVILARKVYAKMGQNLFWALGYNVVAIPAAAGVFIPLGFQLTPQVGAIAMALSSVIVVVNAMTLKTGKPLHYDQSKPIL